MLTAADSTIAHGTGMRATFLGILRHGAIYSVPIAAGKVFSFVLLPLYTRYLTPSDYGALELLDLTSFVAISLLSMRIADAMLYHYFDAPTQRARDAVLSTALLGALGIGAVAGVVGWLGAPVISRLVFTSEQYTGYLRLLSLSVACALPQSVGYSYLRAQNRSVLFAVASSTRLLFQVPLAIWLLVLEHLGVAALLWTSLITYSIEATLTCLYMLRRVHICFDYRLLRGYIAYGAPLAAGSVAMLVLHFGDRYFLQRYVSLAEIGIYALAYKVGMLVAHAQEAFTQYWNAQMFQLLRRDDGDILFARLSTYFTVVSLFIALALSVLSKPLLHVMVTSAYRRAAVLIPVIALAYVLRGLGGHVRTVFFVERRTSLDAFVTFVGAAVCLALYTVFIPRIGLWGAAIATATAFGVMVPLSLRPAQAIRRTAFEWRRMITAGICAIMLCCGAVCLQDSGVLYDAFIGLGSLLAFPILLFVCGFFDAAERALMRSVAARLRGRIAFAVLADLL